eukprot:3380602-Pyramimonas_sp.AAC.1
MLADIEWRRQHLPHLYRLPAPADDLHAWEQEARRSPSAWNRTIRSALASHVRQLQREVVAHTAEQDMFSILLDAGVPPAWDDPRHPTRMLASLQERTWVFMWCHNSFAKARGLRTHILRNHHSGDQLIRRIQGHSCTCHTCCQ